MRIMAHDLRNPMGGISGLAQLLLEDEKLSEDSRHMLTLIENTSKRSLVMINELLESGLGGNAVMPKAAVDINMLLYECVELLQFKAKEKGQHIEFQNHHASVIISGNYEKIWRVFNNLIVNALKFSHTNDIIKVVLLKESDHVLISIADNGIGIPDKSKDSIFEMFTPAKRVGTNGEQPFGLGLSISKNILEKHGGRIWFESKDGEGTIFFVSLPVN
jgi:signal transduction histidine kinase